MSDFDLVVIGSGPGGYVAAIRAAQLGMKVACVEKDVTLGGTCLNVGCIPSKALLDSSEHYHHARTKLQKHGVVVSDVKLDLQLMMKRKEGIVRQLTRGIEGLFKKNAVTRLQGIGTLGSVTGELKEVLVKGASGESTVRARRVLLATGSVPVELPFLKFDGKTVFSSTEALSLDRVPKHLAVVGGGVIGLELGSVWLRLGAKVTVVEFAPSILTTVDEDCAKAAFTSLKAQGMEILTATKCLGAKTQGEWITLEIEDLASGKKSGLECDRVLVATGRRPFSDGLGLKEASVALDDKGRVKVDAHFQTNIPGVFAIGDLIPGPMLAHKAEEDGIAVAELMAGQAGHVNYQTVPNVVYIWPEVAGVGATEAELKTRGVSYKVGKFPFLANGRAKAAEETEGFVKIIADARTDRVLGVHIFGPRASELIAESVSVMEFGGSAEDIARTCHAHPTLSEVVKEAALSVAGRAIHL